MSFMNFMPRDYYLTKLVEKFTDQSSQSNQVDYTQPIHLRNQVQLGHLTLNHPELIQFLVSLLKPKNFLELGFQNGETTHRIIDLIPEQYVAVDIYRSPNIDYFIQAHSNFQFHQTTTTQFLLSNRDQFEMVFIDASHKYEDVLSDFLLVKDHVAPNGFILFHDTYPASQEWTSQQLCGDAYHIASKIRQEYNEEFEILTIPVNPGLSIVRKCFDALD